MKNASTPVKRLLYRANCFFDKNQCCARSKSLLACRPIVVLSVPRWSVIVVTHSRDGSAVEGGRYAAPVALFGIRRGQGDRPFLVDVSLGRLPPQNPHIRALREQFAVPAMVVR